jgi:exopolyphosphatase/guanosine-5'-triphosphate,3'-diphosphate pyrophosphatase
VTEASDESLPEPSQAVLGPFAAVDLGSNSFQLLVASFSHGQLKVIDRLREMVRLAAGLDNQHHLDEDSQIRALECLARFGERLRDVPPENLRVVGTNTLRKARDPGDFIDRAQELLGHEIDVISGIEEARLIYLGVTRTLPDVNGQHLVIDIGGGSTEIAGGEGDQPRLLESLYMGCVSSSRAFFPDGKISAKRFKKARTAARLELRPVSKQFRREQWARVAGASGTIRAAGNVLLELGLTNGNITRVALDALIEQLIHIGKIEDLQLPGLAEQRAAVFPGGIAILAELLNELDIDELVVAQGALREGILYDLIGRFGDEDSRLRTVRAMEIRYHVDARQAERVELTAMALLDQLAKDWKLESPVARRLLGCGARLHEIGLDIAHSHYHRHSAYLLEHADMPGFHSNEQRLLARLVGAHRRKPGSITEEGIPKGWAKRVTRLTIILRLAVLFNRSRTYEFPDVLSISADQRKLTLGLSGQWLNANPLTLADLERERDYLRNLDFELVIAAED